MYAARMRHDPPVLRQKPAPRPMLLLPCPPAPNPACVLPPTCCRCRLQWAAKNPKAEGAASGATPALLKAVTGFVTTNGVTCTASGFVSGMPCGPTKANIGGFEGGLASGHLKLASTYNSPSFTFGCVDKSAGQGPSWTDLNLGLKSSF